MAERGDDAATVIEGINHNPEIKEVIRMLSGQVLEEKISSCPCHSKYYDAAIRLSIVFRVDK